MLKSLQVYTASTKAWTTLHAMPKGLINPGAAVVNGRLYCLGGSNNGALFVGSVFNNVEIYQP